MAIMSNEEKQLKRIADGVDRLTKAVKSLADEMRKQTRANDSYILNTTDRLSEPAKDEPVDHNAWKPCVDLKCIMAGHRPGEPHVYPLNRGGKTDE